MKYLFILSLTLISYSLSAQVIITDWPSTGKLKFNAASGSYNTDTTTAIWNFSDSVITCIHKKKLTTYHIYSRFKFIDDKDMLVIHYELVEPSVIDIIYIKAADMWSGIVKHTYKEPEMDFSISMCPACDDLKKIK